MKRTPKPNRRAAMVSRPICEPVFDDADADLRRIVWRRDKDGYARNNRLRAHLVVIAREYGRPLQAGEFVHFRNEDRQDLRRDNLRLATHRQQLSSRPVRSASGYPGVHWNRRLQHWRALITVSGKVINLGFYRTPQAAADAIERRRQEIGVLEPSAEQFATAHE